MFSGSFVPLVTPFSGGEIDLKGLKRLIEFHLDEGTDGFVPCGTTGESATLSHEEHRQVVKFVIEEVAGRKPVVAGCGSNSTKEALELIQYARDAGADGALVITPYYNKPTQEGLYEHFKFLAERVELPLVLYNVPGRTGVNLLPRTAKRVSEIENVVALKEASGDISQVTEIINLCRENLILLCGEDANLLPILSVGGKGSIAASSNVAPADFANLIKRFNEGNLEEASVLHHKLFPLCKAMFIETNPVPVKTALNLMGMISAEVRLPLVPLREESLVKIKEVLKDYGLI